MSDNVRKSANQSAGGGNNLKLNAKVKQTKKTVKHWVAFILFALMVAVFAQIGITPGRFGDNLGGVAATVNDASISISEFRESIERMEQNARGRLDQFPEAQRKTLMQRLHARALQDLVMAEVIYQAAQAKGVEASDNEVRDYILQIPFFQENGQFIKERYQGYLQNVGLTSHDFERRVRKALVSQKVQELFVASASPSREELKLNRMLSNEKVKLRYAEFTRDFANRPGFISNDEVQSFIKSKKDEILKYYKENTVEFTKLERAEARHILVRADEKRPASEALRLATNLRKEVTPQNFAKLAEKNSDDPMSKAKGGSLGEFERGRMVPEFDKAVFAMEPGQISDPVKTTYGYHIIYLEKKTPGGTQPLEQVQNEIALKLLTRSKESEILAKAKELVTAGDQKAIDAFIAKNGLKWTETGEFDLAARTVPKLGDSREVIDALLKHGKSEGLIKQVIDSQGRHFIVDVVAWKELPDKDDTKTSEGTANMLAERKSMELFEAWIKQAEADANVQTNPRMLQ